MKKIQLLTLLGLLSYGTSLATIKYVTPSGSGTKDGSSWANASGSSSLKSVLDNSSLGDTIWVAKGTYWPSDVNRNEYFEIKDGVKVYGGFAGDEPVGYNLAFRDFATNETILSGNIDDLSIGSDNSFHVVYTQNVSSATIVDGFTIQDGNASNGSLFPEDRGGGWFNTGRGSGNSSNPTIRNIIFKDNKAIKKGGALCNDGYQGITSPTITNCVFDGNSVSSTDSDAGGGAIYNEGLQGKANPIITNCVFKNNSAINRGGALFNNGSGGSGESSPVLSNVEFSSNSAESGGAIYNEGKFDMLSTNSKFNNNSAINSGGAVYNNEKASESSVKLINCIISNNTAALGSAFNNYSVMGSFFPGFLTLRLTNCTVYNNSATTQGGVIYSSKGTNGMVSNFIRNSIFWDNPTVFNNNNTTINISHSIVKGADCVALGTSSNGGVSCGAGMLFSTTVDYPQFVDAANGNFQLLAGSPAINTGDNSIVTTTKDLAGKLRIRDGILDMGAFENSDAPIYVNHSQTTGNNNGSNWANAFTDLQDALFYAKAADAIWVAEGTYKPAAASRDSSFVIPDSVKVYGGFEGNEAGNYNLVNRNFITNETILSGDIGTLANTIDNSYHVVYTKNTSSSTLVDGFSIKDGNANGNSPNNFAGGWYNDGSGTGNNSSPTLMNIIFSNNNASVGGAMYNNGTSGGNSSPQISNCSFSANTASVSGGAMNNHGFNGNSSPQISNCSFSANTALAGGGALYNTGQNGNASPFLNNCFFSANTALFGGAMFNNGFFGNSSPQINNCSFSANTATNSGGTMYNQGQSGNCSPNLSNCTFYANTASNFGGVMFNNGVNAGTTNPSLSNCILWENLANSAANSFHNRSATLNISYSLVPDANEATLGTNSNGGITASNMVYGQNPNFVNAAAGNLQLQNNSPAIDAGTNAEISFITDIIGQKHINVPDMGAYENPCSKIQNITSVVNITTGKYRSFAAVQTLSAANTINPVSNVYYQAGESILLTPGFEVKSNNVFEAVIADGCP
ncbi:polymorphic outer membrane protein repeat-containing protein [Spirosomataceae bacterium TFI 002]|nr:polymorphic outer membrane protein repeat-containing protein [Spirosomataceae bacterium TFI 002]